MSSSQDIPSDTFNSHDPSSEPDPNATHLQLDPSTLSQVLTGAIQLAQSAGSSVPNKNKMPKAKKPRKSKADQPKPRSPPKSKSRKPRSKKSKKPKSDDESSNDEDEKGRRTTIHWENDDNGAGKSSMYLLLNWLTDEHNFSRFKDNKSEKRAVAEEIERYFIDNGITWRDANTIRKKIMRLEEAWRKADGERNRTGQGTLMTAKEVKAAKGWADDNPEWIKMEKLAFVSILKKCRYFVELEPVFGTRHANVRLSAAHGLPAPTQDLESEVQIERDSREHSVNSNLGYEELQSRSMQEALSTNAVEEGLNSGSEEPTMEDFMNVLNDKDEITDDGQPPYTPTPFRARESNQAQSQTQTTSSSLKRTGSRNSVDSTSVGTFSKRSRTSGSASSIQGLLQGHHFGSTPLQASSNDRADPNINSLEQQVFFKHGQSMERLAQVVENMGSSICGQQPKQTKFSPEEAKKKSQIELELVDVKLSSDKFDLDSQKEKHSLEMKQMKAEYEHQQVARNAHLISTLMKEHNLSLQDAMLAAQHAQSMMQSTSGSGSGV